MSPDGTHSLLRRQIKRHFGEPAAIPPAVRALLDDVNAAYREFDTDRRMLERSLELSSQELFQANAELRAAFQAIPDLLFRIDHEGVILSAKSGSLADLLRAPGDLVGRRIQDVPDAFAGPKFAEAIRQVNREQTIAILEYEMTRGGRPQRYEARLVPAPERQIVVIIRNITEHKHLEEQLRQSQKMQAFGQLAGGVAHDFNNLLTVIIGNLELMQAGALSPAECDTAFKEISDATGRARDLTRQLLTFSRRQPMRRQFIDLNDVLANTTRLLKRLIGEHITLETEFAPACAPVLADPGMMEQAIMNLAVNSRDAMPNGGRLRLQTLVLDLAPADLAGHPNAQPGPAVCLRVTDTGAGVDPAHLPHIFEPFFTTKEVGKGTGLGLATVFGIVEQHQGWIEVASRLNEGASFSLYFPRAGKVDDAPAPALFEQPVNGSEHILLVEDEVSVRTLLHHILERHGYHVTSAANAREALDLWDRLSPRPSLLITDMVMPGGVNGRELAGRLRAATPGLKVIFCSGYTDEVLGQDSGLRGHDCFLEKPLDWRAFLQRVRATLDGP